MDSALVMLEVILVAASRRRSARTESRNRGEVKTNGGDSSDSGGTGEEGEGEATRREEHLALKECGWVGRASRGGKEAKESGVREWWEGKRERKRRLHLVLACWPMLVEELFFSFFR